MLDIKRIKIKRILEERHGVNNILQIKYYSYYGFIGTFTNIFRSDE